MLYCIQVRVGSEEQTVKECRRIVRTELLDNLYTPKKLERFKLQGKWIDREKILFPGYIFVELMMQSACFTN